MTGFFFVNRHPPGSPGGGGSEGGGQRVARESLDKSFPWAFGFFFGNTELSLELWNVIAGISGLDDS